MAMIQTNVSMNVGGSAEVKLGMLASSDRRWRSRSSRTGAAAPGSEHDGAGGAEQQGLGVNVETKAALFMSSSALASSGEMSCAL
jgi:hypothetical protein